MLVGVAISPLLFSLKAGMGNTASSEPTQNHVQGLVIEESDITTLNFHNDTLTYILVSIGIAVAMRIYGHNVLLLSEVQAMRQTGKTNDSSEEASRARSTTPHQHSNGTPTIPIWRHENQPHAVHLHNYEGVHTVPVPTNASTEGCHSSTSNERVDISPETGGRCRDPGSLGVSTHVQGEQTLCSFMKEHSADWTPEVNNPDDEKR